MIVGKAVTESNMSQNPICHRLRSSQNPIMPEGKAVTESNMLQNQIVTKSN